MRNGRPEPEHYPSMPHGEACCYFGELLLEPGRYRLRVKQRSVQSVDRIVDLVPGLNRIPIALRP